MFQFWLGFPGFHVIGDTYNSIALAKNDAHPVFIAYVVEFLYKCFGKHLYYLYLFNLVPFHAALAFLVCGLYIHFRSKFALLALFPLFIGNIYFQNFIQYHSFALPMMLLCVYSILLFLVLVPLCKIWRVVLWVLVGVLLFFAILWRHNAIFSVYPAFFIICYLLLRGLEGKKFVLWYIVSLVVSAVLCVGIVVGVPKMLVINKAYPANHMVLHKIAGACVPADDSSCFRKEWYAEGKTWENVKEVFYKFPLNADPMNVGWGYGDVRPFKPGIKLEGLNREFFKAALKYPKNFLKLEGDFIKAMWVQNPKWMFNSQQMQGKPSHPWHVSLTSTFPKNERSVTFSPLREKIYTFLFEHKFTLNHIVGVVASAVVMILSFLLLCVRREKVGSAMVWIYSKYAKILRRDKKEYIFRESQYVRALLVFSFSVGFAGFFSAFFIAAFSTVPETRYMSPVTALGVMAFIGFVVCVCEYVRCVRERE
ncbi:hypothetical protein CQA49_09135 [Helicobacter sp. MIT 00-7814]|nr:hypothetical protein CQA37_09315 [Helicobacter sp. MIT 99-10781]RDU51843.1 hypothetical protein CQA49_09135 [Helicobacter sp. MIT 00-7814]